MPATTITCPTFQRSDTHFLETPYIGARLPGTLNADVMPRFERVVALPNLKSRPFPRRINTLAPVQVSPLAI